MTEERPNELLCYETIGLAGVRASWEMHFRRARQADETDVRAVMNLPFGRLSGTALALIGKPPAEEQAANLRRLKQLLETGRVTDTSYAVAGKFLSL